VFFFFSIIRMFNVLGVITYLNDNRHTSRFWKFNTKPTVPMFLFSFSNYVHQRGYCWVELYKGALNFLVILLFNLVISICLDYLKVDLNFMSALNFNILYLFGFFKFKVWEMMKEVRWWSMIPEMLKLNFKNTSTNISIPNHISNDRDHIWHQSNH
jgi:hypothetical protein